jgi:ABC-type Mn2+/Zn2+ transport system permease subunit
MMEIIWIVTGILCIVAGIRFVLTGGTSKIPIFALMSLICFLFAWIRHRQRKKSKL